MKITSALLALFLLCCCAPQWQKPGTTTDEMDAAQDACTQYVDKLYPQALHQRMLSSAYTTPSHAACFGSPDLMDCLHTQNVFVPPAFETVDDNKMSRDKALQSCMQEKGWQPVP